MNLPKADDGWLEAFGFLIALIVVIEVFVVARIFLVVEILASMIAFSIVGRLARKHAQAVLVIFGLIMLVTAAVPVDIIPMRGRFGVDVRPIVMGFPTKRNEAIAGEVVFAGDLPPLYPARYAIVVSW